MQKTISQRLSSDIIAMLLNRGFNAARIGAMLGVTKSFISRVKSGQRSLTLEHLAALEAEIGEPMPYLLIKSTPLEEVKPELRPLYRATLKLLAPRKAARQTRKAKAA